MPKITKRKHDNNVSLNREYTEIKIVIKEIHRYFKFENYSNIFNMLKNNRNQEFYI